MGAINQAAGAMIATLKAAPVDLPWGDLKVAYAIDDDAPLVRWWDSMASNKRKLPLGWELCEINGEGARCVAVFRVAGIPTIADGQVVQRFLDAIRACEPPELSAVGEAA